MYCVCAFSDGKLHCLKHTRQHGRVVKAADSKSAGFIPRRFKSCCCRKGVYIFFCHFFNLLPPHHYVLLHLSHPSPPNLPHHHPPTLLPTTTTNSSHISIPNQHFTQSSTFNTTQHKRKRKHTHTSPNLPQDNPQINTHNVHNTYNIDTHSGPQHQTTNNPHMCHNKQSTTATTTASPYPSVTSSTLPYNSHTRLR